MCRKNPNLSIFVDTGYWSRFLLDHVQTCCVFYGFKTVPFLPRSRSATLSTSTIDLEIKTEQLPALTLVAALVTWAEIPFRITCRNIEPYTFPVQNRFLSVIEKNTSWRLFLYFLCIAILFLGKIYVTHDWKQRSYQTQYPAGLSWLSGRIPDIWPDTRYLSEYPALHIYGPSSQ